MAGGSPAAVWTMRLLGDEVPGEVPHRPVLYWNLETFARARAVRYVLSNGVPRVSSVYAAGDPLPVAASALKALRKLRRDLTSR